MKNQQLRMGNGLLHMPQNGVEGEFVTINNERFYRIANYDLMPDFFMSIVSDSDHWMFLSSNGSLTAGRKDRDNALFPYYTDDKIHDFHGISGSKTIIQCHTDSGVYLWEPFSKELQNLYTIERNIYKSVYGNKIMFEEINHDLNLRFEYGWYNSDKFGFIKQSRVESTGDASVEVTVLDGISNILPSEVAYSFQNEYSNLLDGYKKSELLKETSLGLFMLSAIPIDRAEPSESLRTTTVWSKGVNREATLLSNKQLDAFRRGQSVETEVDVKGTRGAYYVVSRLHLTTGKPEDWMFVAEVNQTTTDVSNLNHWLSSNQDAIKQISQDIISGTRKLKALVASADGLQSSEEELTASRHFSNTLFNIMRGGIYLDNYSVERNDFTGFVKTTNSAVASRFESWLKELPQTIPVSTLMTRCQETLDADLIRIGYEYLPLTFSRRHGDPSRPWNLFSIVTKDEEGNPISDYQGNWRDIFQNWEALSMSYPGFISNIICKFLNASTADGYNPYRIMKDGIDWERPDPHDPWAYIGYWGDHQIIYLQKLLEIANGYYPAQLSELLTRDIFAYANVPYRIKPYAAVVQDPKNTIDFDEQAQAAIETRVAELGADGRLLPAASGEVLKVNMAEKLMVTLLVKLSNFIPGAGIWLNTQRPEWNDANNALVGNGVSVVTLCYVRRFLAFWLDHFMALGSIDIQFSEEVSDLFEAINGIFEDNGDILTQASNPEMRRKITDLLGHAGCDYRTGLYNNQGFSGQKKTISAEQIAQFISLSLKVVDQCIRENRREDGLYHAYNLISLKHDKIDIRYLYEMLEGQVAVLSSGLLSSQESLEVLDALKASKLFRENQYSYLLYPDRELPRFTEKNNLPSDAAKSSELIRQLLIDGNTKIVTQDEKGELHFSSRFHNAAYLESALDELDESRYGELVKAERQALLDIYEGMFDHQSFTGRSGTFYAYEGLGSIYWHMVSKLLLAVNETFIRASHIESNEIIGRLKEHYYEIKAGIGLFKSPELYGAFPTDAYSHTVRDAGVKQPGMTGQVKEDVISRFGELGIRIHEGVVGFDAALLNEAEFLSSSHDFEFLNLKGEVEHIRLEKEQLAFSFCQVPVVCSKAEENSVELILDDGNSVQMNSLQLSEGCSLKLFERTGRIRRINVHFKV